MKLATLLLLLALALPAHAAKPVRFCDVCPGYTISKRGDDVFIRCPGEPIATPWMTFKDCKNPVVKRTATDVTITCNFERVR